MGLIGFFRILEAIINFFVTYLFIYLFFCMNYAPNQNEKVLEEALAGSNSDAVKTTLRRLRYFKITFPLL